MTTQTINTLKTTSATLLKLALVAIVVGSLTGEWRSIMQRMGLDTGFWFGSLTRRSLQLG